MEFNSENTTKCVCKGIRTCLLCESKTKSELINDKLLNNNCKIYIYCEKCGNRAYDEQLTDHTLHNDNDFIIINGVFVADDVISIERETDLVNRIDSIQWCDSQSGRRKHDFGPKVNFKRQNCKIGSFCGFPKFSNQLFNELKSRFSIIKDFTPVELCHLEYVPERGSAIDPHFDDVWLWGERLITVNLLSPTILTLTDPNNTDIQIQIPLPSRSLLILYGDARYKLQHSIKREHINSRRIAITWRELTRDFLPEGQHYNKIGKEILTIAGRELDL